MPSPCPPSLSFSFRIPRGPIPSEVFERPGRPERLFSVQRTAAAFPDVAKRSCGISILGRAADWCRSVWCPPCALATMYEWRTGRLHNQPARTVPQRVCKARSNPSCWRLDATSTRLNQAVGAMRPWNLGSMSSENARDFGVAPTNRRFVKDWRRRIVLRCITLGRSARGRDQLERAGGRRGMWVLLTSLSPPPSRLSTFSGWAKGTLSFVRRNPSVLPQKSADRTGDGAPGGGRHPPPCAEGLRDRGCTDGRIRPVGRPLCTTHSVLRLR